jgi:heme exporter protein A
MSSAAPSLEVRNLSCIRGDTLLFDALEFRLNRGQAILIEGANGAGKTSLLRILAGITLPAQGDVFWGERPISEVRTEFNEEMAYLGHQLGFKAELTGLENLIFSLKLRGLELDQGYCQKIIAEVGLQAQCELPVIALSAGQRQRLALARILLQKAMLWILDEPLTALDTDGVQHVFNAMQMHLEQGGLIVLTSHQPITGLPNLTRLKLS